MTKLATWKPSTEMGSKVNRRALLQLQAFLPWLEFTHPIHSDENFSECLCSGLGAYPGTYSDEHISEVRMGRFYLQTHPAVTDSPQPLREKLVCEVGVHLWATLCRSRWPGFHSLFLLRAGL